MAFLKDYQKYTYIIVFLDKFHYVGRVISELADGAALYQLTQFTVDRDLVFCHREDDGHLRLGDLVCQLTDRRIILQTHNILSQLPF